jgi:hypothetical protein
VTHVGSLRKCPVPDVVPPLACLRLWSILGIFHRVLSVFSICHFKTFHGFWHFFFIPLGTMFQASTALLEKNSLLKFKGSAALLVVLMDASIFWNHVVHLVKSANNFEGLYFVACQPGGGALPAL